MAVSTTTTLAGIIPELVGEVIYQLNQTVGILDCVRWVDTKGQPGVSYDFPVFSAVTSSSVYAKTEGTDYTTWVTTTNTAVTATVTEHTIPVFVTDLAIMGVQGDLISMLSQLCVNAIRSKLESDIVALFSGFTNAVAGAATALTIADITDAMRYLKDNNANMNNLVMVISPKQFYGVAGAKGVAPLLKSDNVDAGSLGEEMKQKGFVVAPMGIPCLVSNEIDENVASGGDALGCIMDRGALGLHSKGLVNIELQRDASNLGTELICSGLWNEVELVDGWGVEWLSDVA